MDNRGEAWKSLLVMIPSLAATLVAVSRIMDARHHPFDVITGSLLGIICACISYRQYFPSLNEPWKKGRAYPIRTWGRDPVEPVETVRLAGADGSTAALRNPEEERLNDASQSKTTGNAADRPLYLPESNPYTTNMYGYSRRDEDDNWSSSSEDVAGGYEMQPGYARTQNPALNGPTARFDVDTAYHSQTPQVVLGAPTTTHETSGALPNHPDRGRDLTDVPYREV